MSRSGGRRGSDYVVPGNLVFLLNETGMSGIFELHQGCQVPFRISRGNVGFLSRCCSGKGPHFAMRGEPRDFSRVLAGFWSYDGELREPLVVPQLSPISIRVVRGSWGLLSSHCMANRPHLGLCLETPCSSSVATGISGCIQHSPGESGLVSSGSKELHSPLKLRRVSLGAH